MQCYTFFCLFQVCCSPVAILHVYILLSISSMLFTSGNPTCLHSSVYFKYVVHQWQSYMFTFLCLFQVCCSPVAILHVYIPLSISSMLFTSGNPTCLHSSVYFKYVVHQWQSYMFTFLCLFQVCCSPVAILHVYIPLSISSMLFTSGNPTCIHSSVYFKYVVHQWQSYMYTFLCLFQVCCSPVAILHVYILLSISSMLFTSGNPTCIHSSVYFKYVVHQWQSYMFTFLCLFQVCCSPVAILHVYIPLSISSMLFTSGNPTCLHSSVYFKYVVHQWQSYMYTFLCLFQVCCSPVAILHVYIPLSISSMLFTSGKPTCIHSSVYFKYVVHQWQSYMYTFLCLFQVCCSPVAILHVYIPLSISSMLFTSGNPTCLHSSVYFKYVVHQWQAYMYTFFCLFQVFCSPVAILHVYIPLSISSMLFTSGNPTCIHSSVYFKYVVHQWQSYMYTFLCLFQVCCSPVAILHVYIPLSISSMLFTSGNPTCIHSSVYFKNVVHQWQSYMYTFLCLFQVCCSPVASLHVYILLSISSMLFTNGNPTCIHSSVYFKYVVHQWQSYMYTFFCLFQVCCSPVAILHVYIPLSISSMLFTSGNPTCIHSSVYFKYVVHQWQSYMYTFLCLFQVCCSPVAILHVYIPLSISSMLFTSGKPTCIHSSVYFKYVVHQWQSYMYTFLCLFQVCCSPVAILHVYIPLSISSMLFTSGKPTCIHSSVYFKYVVHQWQSYMYTFLCLFQVCCSPVASLHVYILLSILSMLFTSGNVISSYCLKYAVHQM